MDIKNTLLIGFLIIIILVGIEGVVSIYQLNTIADPLSSEVAETIGEISQKSELDALARQVQFYDEVLTQSARNYAFTQDEAWLLRYQEFEPKLDNAINKAIEEGDDIEKEFFSSVGAANALLVQMEAEAIDHVKNNEPDKAVKILDGNMYAVQKQIYQEGITSYVEKRSQGFSIALESRTKALDITNKQALELIGKERNTAILFTLIILGVAASVGFVISRMITIPIARLREGIAKIKAGHFKTKIDPGMRNEIGELAETINQMASELAKSKKKIEQSALTLEKRVGERTRQLEKEKSEAEKLLSLVANREKKMIELKKRIKELERKKS